MKIIDADELKKELLRLGFYPAIVAGAIERLAKEKEWIPCSERKPPEIGRYLVSYGKNTRVFIEEWDGHWFSERHYFEQPKAWMELPEPWKGE